MGSHTVTCHPTQVNTPRLTPAMQAGTRFTYAGGREGWVDLVDLIAPRPGVEPATFRSGVRRRTAAPPSQVVNMFKITYRILRQHRQYSPYVHHIGRITECTCHCPRTGIHPRCTSQVNHSSPHQSCRRNPRSCRRGSSGRYISNRRCTLSGRFHTPILPTFVIKLFYCESIFPYFVCCHLA